MNRKFFLFLYLFALVGIIGACEKDDDNDDIDKSSNNNLSEVQIVNREIYKLMKDIYLWNDQLPEVDPTTYGSPQALLNDLRYAPYDRWSTVMSKQEFQQYFEQGQMAGHGFLLSVDAQDNIRIAFVYRNTQAYQEGVRRSWIIETVNGREATTSNIFELLGADDEGLTNAIGFLSPDGNPQVITLTKELININAVLHAEVINYQEINVGYMVFQDFIENSKREIDSVFTDFKNAGITELVIDLRYNGGGSVDVAENIAAWIGGASQTNDIFYKLSHNNNYSAMDTLVYFRSNPSAISLDRVYFITTEGSASASEMLINGLEPFYNVRLAGATTHGKPVGMYAMTFTDYNYTVLPISFKYENANDYGDFFDGIPVDISASDDVTHMFGDPEEASLKAVLNDIAGTTTKAAVVPGKSRMLLPSDKGIFEVRRAY